MASPVLEKVVPRAGDERFLHKVRSSPARGTTVFSACAGPKHRGRAVVVISACACVFPCDGAYLCDKSQIGRCCDDFFCSDTCVFNYYHYLCIGKRKNIDS